MYNSPFCDVEYMPEYNCVLVTWKSFCCGDDYRTPLIHAAELIKAHKDCVYVADTRSGFEDADEDTVWVKKVWARMAYDAGCRFIYFIIDRSNSLKDELDGQTDELAKYFTVRSIYDISEIPLSRKPTYLIRPMEKEEYPLLEDFLYNAIYIPKSYNGIPPRDIIYTPLLWRTIDSFGSLPDDFCLVADIDGKPVGAVWVRIADQYGHIDNETPSFSISLFKDYRGRGIGTQMMREMLLYLRDKGYKRASLSVQKENYAVSMYKKVGFEITEETDEEYIMLCPLL